MTFWVTGSLLPFNDQQVYPVDTQFTSSDPPMDTTPYDNFRQGTEIKTMKHLVGSSQVKMWGGGFDYRGRITHEQQIVTYGQAVSFTEFYNNHEFNETLIKFDPVEYISLINNYPFPITFNQGPQQQQEAIIEPFTIPQRLPSTEGFNLARTIKAEIEDGNHLDGILAGNSRIEQFIELDPPIKVRPWLDHGAEHFGDTYTGSIVTPGVITNEQRKLNPYIDTENLYIINQLSADTSFKEVLKIMKFGSGIDEDLRPRDKKSTSAGSTIYGPSQARTGTDSIAFIGTLRGS